jgi:hypothetical protein
LGSQRFLRTWLCVLQWSDAAFFYAPVGIWLRPHHFVQRLTPAKVQAIISRVIRNAESANADLNNVLKQDYRAIKRRVNASQHFRSFCGAWRTIAGYEAVHMICKGPRMLECEARSAPSLYCWYVWNRSLIHTIHDGQATNFASLLQLENRSNLLGLFCR